MCALREPLGDIVQIILLLLLFTMTFFCIFFQFKELFSKRCSIISCVVQGLVEICKKYMEVNLFLLLTLQYSYIIVLIDNA